MTVAVEIIIFMSYPGHQLFNKPVVTSYMDMSQQPADADANVMPIRYRLAASSDKVTSSSSISLH